MRSIHHELGAETPQDELLELVATLNARRDRRRDPRPAAASRADRPGRGDRRDRPGQGRRRAHRDQRRAARAGPARPRPCTPQGVVELLRHAGTELEGAEAVIVGRSILVGRPLATLLLGENATVTVCHSRTRDLAAVCSRADVLVAAVGSPRLVGAEMVKPGRDRDRRRHQPHRRRAGRRRRLRGGARGRRRDHAGARRGRADDDRDAARQHAAGAAVANVRRSAYRLRRANPPPLEESQMDADRLQDGRDDRRRSPASRSSSSCSSPGSASTRRSRPGSPGSGFERSPRSAGVDTLQRLGVVRLHRPHPAGDDRRRGRPGGDDGDRAQTVALPVAASAITAGLGILSTLLVLYRIIDPPCEPRPQVRRLPRPDRRRGHRLRRLARDAGGGHLASAARPTGLGDRAGDGGDAATAAAAAGRAAGLRRRRPPPPAGAAAWTRDAEPAAREAR